MDPIDSELADLEGRLAFHRRLDAEAEARDRLLAAERAETFRDFLIALPVGLVVGVVTLDGAEMWGRVAAVGVDKLRLAEVAREGPAPSRLTPRRVHDIRFEAIARVVRDAEEWNR